MVAIAIVGQGYMGKTHAEAWAGLGPDYEIKYVVARSPRDPDFPALGAHFVSDFESVLSDPAVDVVSVCTPTAVHPEFAIRALRAGKHVLLEKPVALTLADARRVITTATQSDAMLMVAHVVRFFAGYELARVTAQSGELGEVHTVRAERLMATPEWSSWISDEAQSGGVLVDFAVHDFDQANLLLGAPESVSSTRESLEGAIVSTVTYAGGGRAEVVTNSWLPQGSPFSSTLSVNGSAGALSYHFAAAAPSESGKGDDDRSTSRLTVTTATSNKVVTVPENKPYRDEIKYFLACIETGTEPTLCPLESSLTALATALAARESLRTNSTVRVEAM